MKVEEYQQRAARFAKEASHWQRRFERYSYARLVLFFGGVAAVILAFQVGSGWGLVGLLLALVGFVRFVRWHEGLVRQADFYREMCRINEREGLALTGDVSWNVEGTSYLDHRHPYSADLDLFGAHSLFQQVSRAVTEVGREKLAGWMSSGLDHIDMPRQGAVRELASRVDWRQTFQAKGHFVEDDPNHLTKLREWIRGADLMKGRPMWIWCARLLPFVVLPSCLILAWQWGLRWAWLPLLLSAYWLWRTKAEVDEIHRQVSDSEAMLKTYASLLAWVEQPDWQSAYLREHLAAVQAGQPSSQIQELSYAVGQLNVRDNFFAILFNLFGLWDLHWVHRLEKIKSSVAPHLEAWFEALAEVDAISGLGNLAHSHPDWCFPTLSEEPHLEAVGLGHPLILPATRITNDLSMPLAGHIKLITGSNMAGKSTFLRTVGANLVLAMIGGPVCATRFTFQPVRLYTSMRTQDALHEQASSFYAELARLQRIIEAVQGPEPVLFLLDEILKGTNSGDRHRGSEALIKQLLRYQGAGLVATHDLSLTALEAQHEGAIENWYFDVEIKDERLFFDYRIKRGICTSFNASILMRKMGIDVEL